MLHGRCAHNPAIRNALALHFALKMLPAINIPLHCCCFCPYWPFKSVHLPGAREICPVMYSPLYWIGGSSLCAWRLTMMHGAFLPFKTAFRMRPLVCKRNGSPRVIFSPCSLRLRPLDIASFVPHFSTPVVNFRGSLILWPKIPSMAYILGQDAH